MNSLNWTYFGIGIAVLALLVFPLWWMIASRRRGNAK